MKIPTNTPDQLVIETVLWKTSLVFAGLTLFSLLIGYRIVVNTNAGVIGLLIWLLCTVSWMLPLAVIRPERSMLMLDATTGQAELRHRDYRGLHLHRFELAKVQSTRVTRWSRRGTAREDPTRLLTLFVREGMDEGRHPFTNRPTKAAETLAASAAVSDWMKAWRSAQPLDSPPSQA